MTNSTLGTYVAFLKSSEKELFNYLFRTEGREIALEFLEDITEILKERERQQGQQNLREYSTEHPVLASIASVGTSLLSGAEYIGDAIKYIATGELDINSMAQATSTIRGTVMENVDWNIKALGDWDAFDFLYGTGMSMADSALTMPFGWAGAATLGLSAAASATNDALERGLDDQHAFLGGVAAGAFETVFEKVSIGQFQALKDSATASIKDAAKNIAKSMLTNASEETLTEVAGITYDVLMNTDFSQYETTIRAKMAQGMSEEEAQHEAFVELGAQVAEAAASGALMGFGFGAGGNAISAAKTGKAGQALIDAGMGDAIIALAKQMPTGSDAQTLAVALDGKTPTKQQLGQLYNAVVAQAEGMTVEELMTEAIKAREQEQAAQEQASQEDSAQEDTTQDEATQEEPVQEDTVSPENLQTAEYKAPDVEYTAANVKTPTVELKTPSEIAEQAKNAVDGNVPRIIDARNRYEPQKPTMSEAELEALRERIDQSTSGKGPRIIDARNRYEPQTFTMSEDERKALSDHIWQSINHELPRYYDARNQGNANGEANMAKGRNTDAAVDGTNQAVYNQNIESMDSDMRLAYLLRNLDLPIFGDGTLVHALTNKEVRVIYNARVAKIKDAINPALPMIEKAKQAFEMRNRIRREARNMMADTEMSEFLDKEHPNKSFEELIERKMTSKGMSRDQAIQDIYETATKTNAYVNKAFGVGGDE